jgi:hypothetical protein
MTVFTKYKAGETNLKLEIIIHVEELLLKGGIYSFCTGPMGM